MITFISVVVAWVVFRATSLESAIYQLHAMIGLDGVSLPRQVAGLEQISWIILTLAGCWLLPNTQELFVKFHPVLESTKMPAGRFRLLWSPNAKWSFFIAGIALVSFLNMYRVSKFLYYQF